MKRTYMDHGATTPVRREAAQAMQPYLSERYGNASSLHSYGREAKEALEGARKDIAKVLNADAEEIMFTSGGTEGNNTALKGLAFANPGKKHVITSSIEHPCIIEAAKWLGRRGCEITFLPVDKQGMVDPREVEKAIRKDTLLVSVMFANNEIGTIQPIKEIAQICRRHKVPFHTDAVQAFTKLPIDVKRSGIDMLTISSHKIYGPKGMGALYVRKGIKLEPLLHGGGHERGMRSGTENVAGAVGFATAAKLAAAEMPKEMKRQAALRDRLIKEVLKIKDSWLNGHPTKRLPNNASFCFKFIEGEALVMHLDLAGIAASTGSACSSKKLEPSHVLLALGLKPEEAHGSLRITIGRDTSREDINSLVKQLDDIVRKLREMSPFKGGW